MPNPPPCRRSPRSASRAPRSARPRASATGTGAVIVCDGLVRIFKLAELEVVALQGLDLLVDGGEMIAIVGASGSGKSTLLAILGGMDVPSAGRAVVAGYDLGRMGNADRTRFRRRTVGFVWQQTGRNLVPYLSAVDNVELPMVLDGRKGVVHGRWSSSTWWGSPTVRRIGPTGCRVASSSAWPSRSPSPTTPASSSRTSRRASSTAARPPRCSGCSGGSTASWARRS